MIETEITMLIGNLDNFDPEDPQPGMYDDDEVDEPVRVPARTRRRKRALNEIAIMAAEQDRACEWAAEMSMLADAEYVAKHGLEMP